MNRAKLYTIGAKNLINHRRPTLNEPGSWLPWDVEANLQFVITRNSHLVKVDHYLGSCHIRLKIEKLKKKKIKIALY